MMKMPVKKKTKPKKKKDIIADTLFPRHADWSVVRAMMSDPLVVSEDTTVTEACKLMVDRKRGQVSVISRDWKPSKPSEKPPEPLGIFTERDLIRAVLQYGSRIPNMKMEQVMNGPVRTVDIQDDLQHALNIMQTLRIRRLPVVENGRLVGMMTRGRVMEAQRERMVEMEAEANDLESQLVHDPLTGLANRVLFQKVIEREIEKVDRYDGWLGLLMLDIDWFKRVNDTHGHLVGDVVLRQIATILRNTVRRADLLARIGGEEFAVIVAQKREPDLARLAEKIRVNIESETYGEDDNRFPITISIGAAFYRQDMGGRSGLMKAADANLYKAKERGRNRVVGP